MPDQYEKYLNKEIGMIDRNFDKLDEENKKNMRIRKIALENCLDQYLKVKDALIEDAKQNVRENMHERFRKKLRDIGNKIANNQF